MSWGLGGNLESYVKTNVETYVKTPLRRAYWRVYPMLLKQQQLPAYPRRILFVCKGNICRSPFAEQLARRLAGEYGVKRVTFDSAGLEVSSAAEPPEYARLAARELGVLLDGHRSKSIHRDALSEFDLVVAMEERQLRALNRSFPEHRGRFFLLPRFHFDGGKVPKGFDAYNIVDPFGKGVEQFRNCYSQIQRCTADLLLQLAGQKTRERGEVKC